MVSALPKAIVLGGEAAMTQILPKMWKSDNLIHVQHRPGAVLCERQVELPEIFKPGTELMGVGTMTGGPKNIS